jgi:glycosyltransferase involved in cell wall biosynthesis
MKGVGLSTGQAASTDGRRRSGARLAGRPLRVVMVTASYLPEHGGTAIHTHEVARRLAGMGVDMTVLSTSLEGPFLRDSHDGPVRVVRVRAWPPGRDYYLAPGLAREIRSGDMDLLHCQGYHTFVAPLAMMAAFSARVPYVVTFHSGGHSSQLRRAIRPLQAWLLRPLFKRARALIAVSQFEAQLFARRLRLPLSSFHVIPSGVELPPARSAPPPAVEALILCIGRLESYKGHHRVIEALPALRRARPDIRLRLVGSGPYEPQLRRLADRLGVADIVDIAPIPADRRDELVLLLQRGAVVAMLSDYESQGLAIQEALALGRPLVVSDNSALADLARHANVRALLQSAGADAVAAAILELLDAPSADPPPMLTWDDCAAALLEVYKKALA